MKPLTRTIVVDSLAFVGFVLLTSTGILLHYLLPPGSGRRSTLWGLDRHEWGSAHFYIALASLAVLTVHLFLHRRWIAGILKGHPPEGQGTRLAAGLVGLLALMAVAVGPLVSPVERTAPAPVSGDTAVADGRIRGSMTLRELAYYTGVPAAEIIAGLSLPAETAQDEPLGRLLARHGLRMSDLRAVVSERVAAKAASESDIRSGASPRVDD